MIVVLFVFSVLCLICLLLTCMKLFAFCFSFRALRVRVTTACYLVDVEGANSQVATIFWNEADVV